MLMFFMQILIPIVQSAAAATPFGLLAQPTTTTSAPRAFILPQQHQTTAGNFFVRTIHPVNKLPLPKLPPRPITKPSKRPPPKSKTAASTPATVDKDDAKKKKDNRASKDETAERNDTFTLDDVTKVDSALPDTILATEEEDEDENEVVEAGRPNEASEKPSDAREKIQTVAESVDDEITEIVPVPVEGVSASTRARAERAKDGGGHRKRKDGGGDGKLAKSKSIYSIAALCQISVNIGDPSEGMINSPGMVSVHSAETSSPVGTPAPPTPTPVPTPTTTATSSMVASAPKASVPAPPESQSSGITAVEKNNELQELLLPDSAEGMVNKNSSISVSERRGKVVEKHASKSKPSTADVLSDRSKYRDSSSKRQKSSSDLSVFEFNEAKSTTPPAVKFPRTPSTKVPTSSADIKSPPPNRKTSTAVDS